MIQAYCWSAFHFRLTKTNHKILLVGYFFWSSPISYLHLSWHLSHSLLVVLSPNFRCWWNFLNFFTAVIGPSIAAYFPIRNLSLSVNQQFFRFLLLFSTQFTTDWRSIAPEACLIMCQNLKFVFLNKKQNLYVHIFNHLNLICLEKIKIGKRYINTTIIFLHSSWQ